MYRWLSKDGPEADRPFECLLDVPLNEAEAIKGMDLTDTHGSIEHESVPPAKNLREIIEGTAEKRA